MSQCQVPTLQKRQQNEMHDNSLSAYISKVVLPGGHFIEVMHELMK